MSGTRYKEWAIVCRSCKTMNLVHLDKTPAVVQCHVCKRMVKCWIIKHGDPFRVSGVPNVFLVRPRSNMGVKIMERYRLVEVTA